MYYQKLYILFLPPIFICPFLISSAERRYRLYILFSFPSFPQVSRNSWNSNHIVLFVVLRSSNSIVLFWLVNILLTFPIFLFYCRSFSLPVLLHLLCRTSLSHVLLVSFGFSFTSNSPMQSNKITLSSL